jgi:long-chain fatty acid transport protein
MRGSMKNVLLGSVAAAAFCIGISSARAGAFLLREQSTLSSGLSTAGAAAGGAGLGSMFWNPATITDYPGWQSSWSITGVSPWADITAEPNSTLFGLGSKSGNIGQNAVIPASYSSYQLNDRIWLGLATYSPFGLVTRDPTVWAGSFNAISAKILSFDVNPTIAYKVSDAFSVAAGFEALWFRAFQSSAMTLPGVGGAHSFATSVLSGSSWGYGFTLGATWKPVDGTEIGIGYRSSIEEDVKGSASLGAAAPPLPAGKYPVSVKLDLPDTLTVGLRQKLTPLWTLLAGFEWDQWSRLGNVPVVARGPLPPSGTVLSNVPFNYNDGWLASLGAEYQWNQNLILRAGFAYEKSPVDNANRQITLPDADRVWASIGATYKVSDKLSLDVAYSHIFPVDGTITYTTPVLFYGSETSHIDIVSVGFKYRWDAPPAQAAPVVAKY